MPLSYIDRIANQSSHEGGFSEEELRASLKKVFDHLGIPVPQEGEHRLGIGHYGQSFIHRAGAVLKVVNNNEMPLLRHRHLMRPIGSAIVSETHRLDLQYGGITPVSKRAFNRINLDGHFYATIDDISIIDAKRSNTCLLKFKGNKEGVPVFFDLNSISAINESVREISKELKHTESGIKIVDMRPQENEEPDEQDAAFSDLREGFTKLFDSKEPDVETAKKFWRSMIEATAQGRLHASWMRSKAFPSILFGSIEHQDEVVPISRSYDRRLKKSAAFTLG